MPEATDAHSLGAARRILLYGVTGSGKSTAAAHIARHTGLPLVDVDELTWLPGWQGVPESSQRDRFSSVAARDEWVLDTAYETWLDVVLPRAELVVALDYARWFSLQRLLRRTLVRIVTRQPVCNGNRETWRSTLGPESIVRWHFRTYGTQRRRMRRWAADPDGPSVLLVGRPSQLRRWLEILAEGTDSSAPAPGS